MDGKRERAPFQGAKVPDIPADISGDHSMEWKRERAPAREVKVSDSPAEISGGHSMDGKRERAPERRVKDSDDPTRFSDSTRGGVNRNTLGGGKGKREQAPAEGAGVSDYPNTRLGNVAAETSEALTGGDGLGYSDLIGG